MIHHKAWYCALLLLTQTRDVRPFSPITCIAQQRATATTGSSGSAPVRRARLQSQRRATNGHGDGKPTAAPTDPRYDGAGGRIRSAIDSGTTIVAAADRDTTSAPWCERRRFLSSVVTMAVASEIVFCGSSFANAAENLYDGGGEGGEESNAAEILYDGGGGGGEESSEFVAAFNDRNLKPEGRKAVDARYFIAGGACASFSHGVATPFDVIKTKIQADPDSYNSGLLSAASTIIEEGGIPVLLSGLGPTVLGFGVEGAMKFGVYETLKPQFVVLFHTADQTIPFLAASVCAGAVASLFLCPLERVRIKMVTDTEFDTGLFSSLGSLIEEEGALQLLKGFPAMLSKQVPYTATKQLSFEMIAGSLYQVTSAAAISLPSTQFRLLVSITSAFLASILACIASNPGDVILTRTFSSRSDDSGGTTPGSSNESVIDVASAIYEERGGFAGGFFSGLSARFWHVGAIVTSQLVVYDFLKQLLGLPATGA